MADCRGAARRSLLHHPARLQRNARPDEGPSHDALVFVASAPSIDARCSGGLIPPRLSQMVDNGRGRRCAAWLC
eukprot:scaffold92116_cov29-Tisochrysis_lutea.AAC.2